MHYALYLATPINPKSPDANNHTAAGTGTVAGVRINEYSPTNLVSTLPEAVNPKSSSGLNTTSAPVFKPVNGSLP